MDAPEDIDPGWACGLDGCLSVEAAAVAAAAQAEKGHSRYPGGCAVAGSGAPVPTFGGTAGKRSLCYGTKGKIQPAQTGAGGTGTYGDLYPGCPGPAAGKAAVSAAGVSAGSGSVLTVVKFDGFRR